MNPQDLLNKAQLMSQQTKAQGATPFAGSSFDSTMVDATKVSTPTTPLNLKPSPQVQIPNITNLVSSEVANPVAPVVPEPQKTSLTDKIAGLFGQTKNKEADLASAVETATSPYSKQLNELNTQIKMQQAKAIQNQELAMQRGETTGFASREAQNMARTDAIETLKLSALAEGMRGNIALAEQHATNAINAKYAQINADLETAKSNIYDNWESLTPAEKKRAEATLLRIDKEDQFVKMQMEDDKITQGFLQEAISQSQANGKPIDTLTLTRASKAGTPTEALQILAPYMVDADAKASALLDRQYKQAQIAKMNADIALTNEQKNKIIAETTGNPETAKAQLQSNEALALAKELIKPTAIGKKEAIGASPSKFFSGLTFGGLQALGLQPDRTAYEAKVDTLKSNLTLDNLKLLKGAMSDKDLLFLNSIGSSLNTGMSEKEFDKELQRVIDKLETAGAVAGTVRMTSPEGVAYDVPSAQVELFKQNGYK